jgi:ubiquinone/menaquinone biosynthesis C-methylase UbiE
MDVMTALPSIERIKKTAIELMKLQNGDVVLEAGCGASIDAELIAHKIGASGKVIGIDNSKKMLALAEERKNSSNILYQWMDIMDIRYGNEYFSACHADRLFVSHIDHKMMFNELVRVVKKGGVVCITDVDVETLVISPEINNTEVILEQIFSTFVNKRMGRQLLNLFVAKDMKNIRITTNLCEITDFNTLCQIFNFDDILSSCVEARLLTEKNAREWQDTMIKYSNKGAFYYCVTFFTVSGMVS